MSWFDFLQIMIDFRQMQTLLKDFSHYKVTGDNSSKIFIFGAVQSVPDTLFKQLSENGSLITVVKNHNNIKSCGKAVVFKKNKDIISSSNIFDVEVPFMEGFSKKEGFNF